MSKSELLKIIKKEVLALETSSRYVDRVKNKNQPVMGEGSHIAKIMFIGEAPGRNEAKIGKPFVGSAGKILSELIKSICLKREDVYITNIIKDRPPRNRDPLPEEIDAYGPFLDREIEILKPEIIVTLGRYSMLYIMKKCRPDIEIEPISKAHGKLYKAVMNYGKIKIIPLYHPAATIYNRQLIDVLKKYFQNIKKYVI